MITITIIILTSLISYQAFKDYSIADKLIFQPAVVRDGEWYRLITYGLLHADLTHLIFNMFTFYLFGRTIESFFKSSLGFIPGSIAFILLYVGGLLFSILPTYLKEKDNYYYKGLGASGAVSAVVFAFILIFLFISMYLDKNQVGGINHSAHVAGGLFGVVMTAAVFLVLLQNNLLVAFLHKIQITSLSQLIYFGI